MPTSAVVFDFYNTLAMPNPNDFWMRIPEIIAEAGGEPDATAVNSFWHQHPVAHVEHSASEADYRRWQRARFTDLLTECGVDQDAREAHADRIDEDRYTRLFDAFDDVTETLAALRGRGHVVGICSNWDWDLDRHLERTGIAEHVDFVVCSAIHGYRKPHPAIFDTVVARVEASPESILFVGDSWGDDIDGARAAGLRPVHIARQGSCPAIDVAHDDVPCVPDARAVLDLI